MEQNEQDLISKKDLLAKYNISYGALYRWKRMGLIPEEWFIRKSTQTGQETFFDRATICGRIEQIILQKDSESLEQLARRLNYGAEECPRLVIHTPYGERTFKEPDIISVSIEGPGAEDFKERLIKQIKKTREEK